MCNQTDPGWTRVAGVLRRLEQVQGSQDSLAVASARRPASSPTASAESTPRGSASRDPRQREYVRAVLGCYLWLPGTSSITSRHDRRCVEQLYRRGVPVDVVKSAMVVAVARRTFRRGDPLPRVRAVSYFLPVVEEMLELPCDLGYVQYLEQRLQPLAAAKVAKSGQQRPQPSC
jgi:hypothetical protein